MQLEGLPETSDLGARLHEDHARLDRLFEHLIAACQANDKDGVNHLWSAFETALSKHMDLEERLLFPALAEVHPAEARQLISEHLELRRKLMDLGIGVDLHLTSSKSIEDFVTALREHAAREDALLYHWAAANLPIENRDEVLQRLFDASRLRRKRA